MSKTKKSSASLSIEEMRAGAAKLEANNLSSDERLASIGILAPGLHRVPAEVYHADTICGAPSLSSSGARKLLNDCPAAYWHSRTNPPEPSEALDVGTAAHEWLLEGDTWPQRFTVLPSDHDGRTREGKDLVRDILAEGKRPLPFEAFQHIKGMVAALRDDPIANAAFSNGTPEMSLYWRDPDHGFWCRARPDWLPNKGHIWTDYKTCQSAHPRDIQRSIAAYGYHMQAEWYLRGGQTIGIDAGRMLFIFQCKAPPYLITPVTLDDETLGWAKIQNDKARSIFARCLETGRWPGYASDVLTLGLPGWARKELERAHEAGAFVEDQE